MASILKVDTIQDQSGNNIINESGDTITIGASGDTITVPTGATMTVPNGGLSGQNYPAFDVSLSADQTLSDNTLTKVEFNTENLDTNGNYDNTTNYRFTPTVAGKYYVYSSIKTQSSVDDAVNLSNFYIYKNGSTYRNFTFLSATHEPTILSPSVFAIIDMNGSTDYLEMFVTVDVDAGTPRVDAGVNQSYFGAYRIGA